MPTLAGVLEQASTWGQTDQFLGGSSGELAFDGDSFPLGW